LGIAWEGGKLKGILPRAKSKAGRIQRESRLRWGGARRTVKFGGHMRAIECGREQKERLRIFVISTQSSARS